MPTGSTIRPLILHNDTYDDTHSLHRFQIGRNLPWHSFAERATREQASACAWRDFVKDESTPCCFDRRGSLPQRHALFCHQVRRDCCRRPGHACETMLQRDRISSKATLQRLRISFEATLQRFRISSLLQGKCTDTRHILEKCTDTRHTLMQWHDSIHTLMKFNDTIHLPIKWHDALDTLIKWHDARNISDEI